MGMQIVADGSSPADAHERVVVDRREERWRWRCPNNHHSRWEDRGGYLLCHSCAEMHDVSPVYRQLYDAKEEVTIPWGAVDLVE